MKKNIRVPMSFSQDHAGGSQTYWIPLAISFGCHLVFLLLFVVTPSLRFDRPQAQSVINVSMVSFKKTAPAASDKPAVAKKTPAVEKPEAAKKARVTPPVTKKTAVATKPATKPKPKTSLKKKTFKSTQVVKQAIQQLEQKVAAEADTAKAEPEPEPLKSALDRLRQEVGKTEADRSQQAAQKTDTGGAQATGKPGKFNENGTRTAQLIDLYRLEIAFQIQKNWAFNQQLAGGQGTLVAAIVFKVMPDGEIRDIFFTDRSGNAYLDDQAYKAIVKSNPVDGHPAGLSQPYVQMGVRFTPQGVR
jgi:colicin import membrane protein